MDGDQHRKADFVVRGRRVVLPGGIHPATIHIRDGLIIRVGAWDEIESSTAFFDAGDHAILPGVVDLHAHINEPGRTAWEGFESATRAAAAGGITTLVDMPLNSIPATVGAAELDQKISATAGKLWIDVGFHGGIVPGNENHLARLVRAGVVGLKCFLCDSGVDEFPAVTAAQLGGSLQPIAELDPWVLVHAECPEVLAAARERLNDRSSWTYCDYLKSRPDEAEIAAIKQLIELAEIANLRIHIVHLSSAATLPLIAEAKARHLRVTVETCPHYLTFEAESIAPSATNLKCAPPIRSAANREALWKGLRDGVIDIIASDHSPCLPELKANRDLSQAWGGISSLQCSLAAVWSEARQRGFGLSGLALWMCQRPAELGRLTMKGCIAPGKDADLICFAPDESFTFDAGQILHRHKLTPYSGRRMIGVVKQTFLRGAMIYDRGSWGNQPQGQVVRAVSSPGTGGVKTPMLRIDRSAQPSNAYEPFPRQALERSIGARFEEIVRRFPEKLAVKTKNYSWTYAELNAHAERIAVAIGIHGLLSAAPILLQFDHDAPAIAALLAVLKAGHFYCALDAAAGPEQNNTIFKSLNPRMLLCDLTSFDRSADLAQSMIPILNVDDLPTQSNDSPVQTQVPSEALAYVFFTSGTTGKPKGVMDSHRNVLHNVLRYTNNLHITFDDRLTLLQTLSFSGSVSSLFCALLNGATIYPFDLRDEGPAALTDWLSEQQITMYHSVPSIFRLIAGEGRRFQKLRVVRLEGDQAALSDAAIFQKHFDESCVLANGLGATECGIARQFFLGARAPIPAASLPIGYPVEDMDISVLDEQGRPAPVGQIGEIAVQSRYLAVGYWHAPDLTSAAFKSSPDNPEMRVYRTGDLGRLDETGCLEYLGRKDFHEKVRGQRVSLADIEAELLRIDGVREAVAAVRPNRAGENQLVVYFTEWPDRPMDLGKLWSCLRERLEPYSLPSALIRLERLPLNANGKIDRRALPDPHRRRLLAAPAISPRTQDESALMRIWQEVLDFEEIGVEDSFIELGGDSLQLMRMINQVRQMFGVEVPIAEFFAAPRIAALAEMLQRTPRPTTARPEDIEKGRRP